MRTSDGRCRPRNHPRAQPSLVRQGPHSRAGIPGTVLVGANRRDVPGFPLQVKFIVKIWPPRDRNQHQPINDAHIVGERPLCPESEFIKPSLPDFVSAIHVAVSRHATEGICWMWMPATSAGSDNREHASRNPPLHLSRFSCYGFSTNL